ncbi:tetratricopeptide repeat protein [bacterium]|nr:tetratricopeptide repeat protein [bacterium]
MKKIRHRLLYAAVIVSGILFLSKCQNEPKLSDEARLVVEQASAALQNGSLIEVLALADSLDIVQSNQVESSILRGRVFFDMGMLAQAESSFVTVLDRAPNYPGLRHNLGNVYYFKKEYRRALEEYLKEPSLPTDPRTWHAISGAYFELGKLDSALVAVANSLRIDSGYGPALVSSSDYKSQRGDYEQALTDLRAAGARGASSSSFRLKLAKLENLAGDSNTAVALLMELVQGEPWNYSVIFELAGAFRRLGEEEKAQSLFLAADAARKDAQPVELLERIVASQPLDFEKRVSLANAYRDQTRFEDAIPHYFAAIRLRPNNLELQANVATVFLQSGNEQEAIARFRSVLLADPNNVTSLLNLSIYFIGKNEKDKAKQLFDRAEQVAPRHPALGKIRAMF